MAGLIDYKYLKNETLRLLKEPNMTTKQSNAYERDLIQLDIAHSLNEITGLMKKQNKSLKPLEEE